MKILGRIFCFTLFFPFNNEENESEQLMTIKVVIAKKMFDDEEHFTLHLIFFFQMFIRRRLSLILKTYFCIALSAFH